MAVFWQWPDGQRGEVAQAEWVRAVALSFEAAQGLAPHRAPAEAVFICVEGTIRFVLEGRQQDLRPGDGVVMRRGDLHAVEPGEAGRALLLLQQGTAEA